MENLDSKSPITPIAFTLGSSPNFISNKRISLNLFLFPRNLRKPTFRSKIWRRFRIATMERKLDTRLRIIFVNPIQDGSFRAGHGWGAKSPPSLKSVTHILQ